MKKLITIVLILALLLPAAASADVPDVSGLSFDELISLRGAVMRAMWASDEWQSVKVPGGVYQIGVDIPEGHWTIQTPSHSLVYIYYGTQLTEPGTEVEFSSSLYNTVITLDLEMTSCLHQIDIILTEGNYISFSGEVIFYPYTGKLDFTFNRGD